MNLRFLGNRLLTIFALPMLYLQGKKIRKNIPSLPEAKNPSGKVSINTEKPINLIAIGESTIAGVGAKTHEEAFTGTLAKDLAQALGKSVDWKVYAKSGYTAQKVTHNILTQIKESQADLILIGLGANNAFAFDSPKKFGKDMEILFDSIQTKFKYTPIVLTNMPPIKEFSAFSSLMKMTIGNLAEMYAAELEKVVKNRTNIFFNSEIIRLKTWSARYHQENRPERFFSDGVHPSKLTYQIWAKDMSQFIMDKNILKKKTIFQVQTN